jgi:hypothetical protein
MIALLSPFGRPQSHFDSTDPSVHPLRYLTSNYSTLWSCGTTLFCHQTDANMREYHLARDFGALKKGIVPVTEWHSFCHSVIGTILRGADSSDGSRPRHAHDSSRVVE